MVRDLGAIVTTDVMHCTHLVTNEAKRTIKFLCCTARGVHIVHTDWLKKCHKAKHILGDFRTMNATFLFVYS